jgi:hypothetical protein
MFLGHTNICSKQSKGCSQLPGEVYPKSMRVGGWVLDEGILHQAADESIELMVEMGYDIFKENRL